MSIDLLSIEEIKEVYNNMLNADGDFLLVELIVSNSGYMTLVSESFGILDYDSWNGLDFILTNDYDTEEYLLSLIN